VLPEVCENPVSCNVVLVYNPQPGEVYGLKFGRGGSPRLEVNIRAQIRSCLRIGGYGAFGAGLISQLISTIRQPYLRR
jgi:hypothetical protein